MKKFILFPILVLTLTVGLRAGEDCDKAADACKATVKKVTPFMAELKNTEIKTAPKGTAVKQGPTAATSLKQGRQKPHQSEAPAKSEPSAPAEPLEGKKPLSSPAWLLPAAALLAGLYYFLRETNKKKRIKD